jgi:hypothetical protein
VAPAGTNALICDEVADEDGTTANVAPVPLKSTAVAFSRFEPLIVTPVPTGPEVGLNEEIVGVQPPGLATVKFEALVAVPSPLITWITPVVAPPGTAALIWVAETMLKEAAVPLKSTADTLGLLKLVPEIVTTQVAGPDVGVNDEIVGARANAGAAIAISESVAKIATPPALPRCRLNEAMVVLSFWRERRPWTLA